MLRDDSFWIFYSLRPDAKGFVGDVMDIDFERKQLVN